MNKFGLSVCQFVCLLDDERQNTLTDWAHIFVATHMTSENVIGGSK